MGVWDSLFKKKESVDLPNFTHEDLDLPPPPPPDQEMLQEDRQFMAEEGLDGHGFMENIKDSQPALPTPPPMIRPAMQQVRDGKMPSEKETNGSSMMMKQKAPAVKRSSFIRVDELDSMVESTNAVKASIRKIEDSCQRMQQVRAEQEKIMEKWKHHLDDAQKKLVYIDRTLFKTVG